VRGKALSFEFPDADCHTTYLPTPWSRVFLKKVTGSQLVLKFPTFYGTRKSITTLQLLPTCPYPEPARLHNVIIHNIAMKTLHILSIFHEFTEKLRNNNEITVNTRKAKINPLPENEEKIILRTSKAWTYFKAHY